MGLNQPLTRQQRLDLSGVEEAVMPGPCYAAQQVVDGQPAYILMLSRYDGGQFLLHEVIISRPDTQPEEDRAVA